MKMTHREFLIWLSGLGSLGPLGGLVKHKIQPTHALEPEKSFELPQFAVRVKHVADGILFGIDRARIIVTAHEEADGKLLWESHGESRFIIPGAAFPIDLSPEGELWVANVGRKYLEQLDLKTGKFIASWQPLEEFGGCCNPVRFAALPGGRFVTMEKGVRRACIYQASGALEQIVTEELSDSEFNYFLVRHEGKIHLYDTGVKKHWEVS